MKVLENKLNNIHHYCDITNQTAVNNDLIASLLGKHIGSGVYRDVYEYNLDDKYVIKLEKGSGACNIQEMLIWNEVQDLKGDLAWVRDFFAPILWVSPNNRILVMRKTEEKPEKERPREVPAFFTDLKRDNWGWIGNKLVCHDYGFIYKFIKYEKKFQKVGKDKWW